MFYNNLCNKPSTIQVNNEWISTGPCCCTFEEIFRRCCFSFYLCFPFSLNNSTSTANYPCPVPPVELLGPFSKLLHIHAMSSLYPQCPLITQSQSRKQASHIRTNTFFFCLIFSTYLKKNDAGSGVA